LCKLAHNKGKGLPQTCQVKYLAHRGNHVLVMQSIIAANPKQLDYLTFTLTRTAHFFFACIRKLQA
jgi:hypothetical protein